ncbi:MAG: NYN domain-containing protein [Deltaproteobacteria bacterium]|nr:NYN domain-containing protein [Deltaproteobacteria bacterium]
MANQDRLNIAVFIDFDNIEIGVKSTLGESFDVGAILDALKERGEVVTKIAYADWTRAGEYSRHLTQHAIRLVQRNLTPGGDKNGADINLALDALEMAFTHPHINAYVIVGGDSDFLSLVEKLKQYDKKVFVVGGRAFTSIILQRNCHEFIAYENLTGGRRSAFKGGRPVAPSAPSPIAQAFPIVRRALKILSDREVSPQTGLLKSTLLQLDSTFSERNFGASSFLDFVEKLAKTGLVQLKNTGRSVMVELNEQFEEGDQPADPPAAPEKRDDIQPSPQAEAVEAPVVAQTAAAPTGDQAGGVRRVAEILTAATTARWPMYLRNVKQLLRAAEGGFDERRYGFQGLIDLLRACQREGLLRLERDRRGGLRVLKGPLLQQTTANRSAVPPQAPREAVSDEGMESMDAAARDQLLEEVDQIEPGNRLDPQPEAIDDEDAAIGPIPIDTTAERLGRAEPRRPRARVGGVARSKQKTTAPKKPAPRPSSRSRKPARPDSGGKHDS